MAMESLVLDISCGAILLLFALIGLKRGFAKQLLGLFAWVAGLVGAFFLFKPIFGILWENVAFLRSARDGISAGLGNVSFLVSMLEGMGMTTEKLANYIIYILFYIILAIAVGIVFAIFRKICVHLSGTGAFRVIDKIFGFVYGAAIGGVIVVCALALVNYILARPYIPFGSTVYAFMNAGAESLTMKYVYNFFMEGILSPYVATTPFMVDLYAFLHSVL